MQVTLDIPDDLAAQCIPTGHDPARVVFEDAMVEAYREGRITGSRLMEALGIETRYDLDGFLKARCVWIEYTSEQLEEDRLAMEAHLAALSENLSGV